MLSTGSDPSHFDVQLLPRLTGDTVVDLAEVEMAARGLVDACGEPRPHPAYAGGDVPPILEE